MLNAVEYIEKENTIMICRCCGSGEILEIPAQIAGHPVTALADHVFASEASFKLRRAAKRIAVPSRETGQWTDARDGFQLTDLPAMCSETLQEIVLPDTIESIGEYAFYGCRNLKKLTIPGTVKQLGGGLFVACNHLEEICFRAGTDIIRDVIGDLSYEVEAVIEDADGHVPCRLLFPEYYEDSIENTPARIIEIKFEGTGYRYRQCFAGIQPDLARYDSLFYTASVQELPATVLKMAFDRLCYPLQLSEESRRSYMQYLQDHAKETAAFCLDKAAERIAGKDPAEVIRFLCANGYFNEERFNVFLQTASANENPEAVSILMDHRRSTVRGKKIREKYDL